MDDIQASPEMTNPTSIIQEIERLDPDTARQTLRVKQCPIGSNELEKISTSNHYPMEKKNYIPDNSIGCIHGPI